MPGHLVLTGHHLHLLRIGADARAHQVQRSTLLAFLSPAQRRQRDRRAGVSARRGSVGRGGRVAGLSAARGERDHRSYAGGDGQERAVHAHGRGGGA